MKFSLKTPLANEKLAMSWPKELDGGGGATMPSLLEKLFRGAFPQYWDCATGFCLPSGLPEAKKPKVRQIERIWSAQLPRTLPHAASLCVCVRIPLQTSGAGAGSWEGNCLPNCLAAPTGRA